MIWASGARLDGWGLPGFRMVVTAAAGVRKVFLPPRFYASCGDLDPAARAMELESLGRADPAG